MITSDLLKSCSEEEQSILYLVLSIAYEPCGYTPPFSCVKYLRPGILVKIFDSLKKQIKQENITIIDNLQKKILENNK